MKKYFGLRNRDNNYDVRVGKKQVTFTGNQILAALLVATAFFGLILAINS